MAICHVSVQVISRSEGRTATGAAAYRSATAITNTITKTVYNYSHKTGVDHSEILTPKMPTVDKSWLMDRTQLWNEVEKKEKRHDAQLAREVNVAIPVELDRQDQIDLVREYVQTSYVDRGMVADINWHDLHSNNPHAHIMLTMRDLVVSNGQIEFGNKNRDWNNRNLLIDQRREWAEITNRYLENAGHEVKIDHRSLVEQGITDRLPQIHLGANVAAMRERGIATDRGNEYDRINAANAEIRHQLEKIYQAETELEELGKDDTNNQQEVNDQPRPQPQEPRPDFSRTRSDLEDLARRPQRHDPSQRERRSQPGADSRPNRENRADRNQPHRDLGTDRRHRAASNLHPEDPQNRPEPALDQTRPIGAAGGSNPDFATIHAEFIKLSHQVRDLGADPEHSPEGERHPGTNHHRRVDDVRNDDVDGSQRQRHAKSTNPAGARVNPAISNPTEGGSAGSRKTQKTESQKVKPLTKPQLTIRPRPNRDVTPTAGELRETYRQKSTFGDKIGLAEIEKLGVELNQIYQQTHPDREKAPDDFKHPDVWIDGKILEVHIPVTINIDPEPESQKRGRSQDYEMGM
jgi:MobA/MobL family